MSQKLRTLQNEKSALVADMRAITHAADAAARDLTAEEETRFAEFKAKLDTKNAAIDRETQLIAEEAKLGIQSAIGTMLTDRREADPKRGFQSFGEFAKSVRAAGATRNAIDERLLIGAVAPGTFGGESVGADGGFAIPPEFSKEIWRYSMEQNSLLPLTDNTEITGNSMIFPKDETTPWGVDGVRAYWQAEATAAIATKPKLSSTTMQLRKLMALVPLSDELLDDTNALQSYLPSKISDSIRWKVDESILWGAGGQIPAGALNSGASVIVAKEAAQATQTLQPANLTKMVARLPEGSFQRAVWVVNNDVLPALWTLTQGGFPWYIPLDQGNQASPYGTLLGRPIMVSQHAKSFSAQGDISLVDLNYYRTITKAGGMQSETSIHLYFDADATAFRTILRMDGQPKIAAPIAPANGTNTLSPFVQLGAR